MAAYDRALDLLHRVGARRTLAILLGREDEPVPNADGASSSVD